MVSSITKILRHLLIGGRERCKELFLLLLSLKKRKMKYKMRFDRLRRMVVADAEVKRMALRYLTHNEALPTKTRLLAQFKLAEMPAATALNRISRRCILSGRGRSIIGEFNISRIRFREMALSRQLVGITKASW